VLKLTLSVVVVATALTLPPRAESYGSTAPPAPRPTGPPCNGTLLNEPPINPQPVLKSTNKVGRTLQVIGTVSREGKVEKLVVTQSVHPAIDKIVVDTLGGRLYAPSRLPDGQAFACGVTYTVQIQPAEWLIPAKKAKK
jgi:hypothetical protein